MASVIFFILITNETSFNAELLLSVSVIPFVCSALLIWRFFPIVRLSIAVLNSALRHCTTIHRGRKWFSRVVWSIVTVMLIGWASKLNWTIKRVDFGCIKVVIVTEFHCWRHREFVYCAAIWIVNNQTNDSSPRSQSIYKYLIYLHMGGYCGLSVKVNILTLLRHSRIM